MGTMTAEEERGAISRRTCRWRAAVTYGCQSAAALVCGNSGRAKSGGRGSAWMAFPERDSRWSCAPYRISHRVPESSSAMTGEPALRERASAASRNREPKKKNDRRAHSRPVDPQQRDVSAGASCVEPSVEHEHRKQATESSDGQRELSARGACTHSTPPWQV